MRNSHHSNIIQLWDSTTTTTTVFTDIWPILTILSKCALLAIISLLMSHFLGPQIVSLPEIILLLDVDYIIYDSLGICSVADLEWQCCNPPAPYIQQPPSTKVTIHICQICIYIYMNLISASKHYCSATIPAHLVLSTKGRLVLGQNM